MFYNRVKKLCDKNQIPICSLVQKQGIAKSAVTGWKNGASPNARAVVLIAKYFNVTTDSLIMDDEPSK